MMDLLSTMQRHLDYLAVTLGARPTGSPANQRAAEYIAGAFAGAGLAVERQEYAVPAWREVETILTLNGAPLAAVANTFSPPCDVTAPTVLVSTLAELEQADLAGRVAVLYGDLTRWTFGLKSFPYKHERDDHVVALLEAGRPAAIVTVQTRRGDMERLIEDWEFELPSVTVGLDAGLALVQRAGATVCLRLDTRREVGTAANVVARRGDPRGERIVVCAHFDTKVDTPGASDNASGAACLLALAEALAGAPLACGLELIAFNNEEYLPLGDDTYVARAGESFQRIRAAINLDGVGSALAATSITVTAGPPAFEALVREVAAAYPGVTWVAPWVESNHSTFAFRGIPAVVLSSSMAAYQFHLRDDTVEWVSVARLAEVVDLVATLVRRLGDEEV